MNPQLMLNCVGKHKLSHFLYVHFETVWLLWRFAKVVCSSCHFLAVAL